MVTFERPYCAAIHHEPVETPGPGCALVQTLLSAISAGTELLFYRGQVPAGMAADASFAEMQGVVAYPIAYGYACVGQVIAVGEPSDEHWLGKRVFAFRPHASHFLAPITELLPLPPGLTPEQAVFLPNMETAVNLVMDGRPLAGERVLILGQGVVGLLTTSLLARFPLSKLIAVDAHAPRLALARRMGAHLTLPPDAGELAHLDPDLIFELSSNPAALAAALEIAGFGARIVVGSWYGDKPVTLPLGGMFHRNRIRIISSQVSTLDGSLTNRWSKQRRLELAWELLRSTPVQELITHRLPVAEAPAAYALLDQHPDQAIQVLFTY
ncbi:MAG TPA: zinc-binding alcohol dehydrogenase [Caldilineaceae bacterium]|nr:zinc-binding alcohol dehydrogenase [Caldilineaceae bacterium]